MSSGSQSRAPRLTTMDMPFWVSNHIKDLIFASRKRVRELGRALECENGSRGCHNFRCGDARSRRHRVATVMAAAVHGEASYPGGGGGIFVLSATCHVQY